MIWLGCVIVTEDVFEHPTASVTRTVYVPGERFEILEEGLPVGDHKNVYGEEPPEGETLAAPLLLPLQLTFVAEEFAEMKEMESCLDGL